MHGLNGPWRRRCARRWAPTRPACSKNDCWHVRPHRSRCRDRRRCCSPCVRPYRELWTRCSVAVRNSIAPRWIELLMTRSDSGRRSPRDAPGAATDPGGNEIIAILDTIDVPILVVAPDCTLGRLNRAAIEAFSLAPTDIGRRLNTVAALGDAKDIEKLCGQVIADNAPSRRDIRSGDRRFLLRVAPYALASGERAGAVLTFTNVTAFRASIEQAIYEREYTKAILNTITNPLVVLDARLRVQAGNRVFYSTFGISREKAQGMPLRDLGAPDWQSSGLWAALSGVVSGHHAFEPLEVE